MNQDVMMKPRNPKKMVFLCLGMRLYIGMSLWMGMCVARSLAINASVMNMNECEDDPNDL